MKGGVYRMLTMASGEVPVLQAGKKDKFVFKKGPFLLLKTSLSFF